MSISRFVTLTASKAAPSAPVIDYVCANQTYVTNNTNISVRLKARLDTLINLSNVSIITPGNDNITLLQVTAERADLTYTISYYFHANQTGNYTLVASVRDMENNNATKNSTFFVVPPNSTKTVNVTALNISKINLRDSCSGDLISNGSSILITIPDNALLDIEHVTAKPIVTIHQANLTNTSILLNYSDLGTSIAAPAGKRLVAEFALATNLTQYANVTIVYNYTDVETSLDDETGLVIYKCPDPNACTWTLQAGTVLNTSLNTISLTVSSLSGFLVAETATTTTTVTNTVTQTTSGGGGGVVYVQNKTNVTMYAGIDIIAPLGITLYFNDQIVAPIVLINKGNISLGNISISAITNSTNVTVSLDTEFIEKLGIAEQVASNLLIKSGDGLGDYTVEIIAEVNTPEFSDVASIILKVTDKQLSNKTIVGSKLQFVSDIFTNNPECIEL
ncbi:MAG: hypothetical protein AABY14_01355, partial [Nanoarchaeota archaeon]